MTVEQLCQNPELKIDRVVEKLKTLANQYFFARFLEISSLLDYLLERKWLKQENLAGGPVLDLGTGSGIGLVVLRKFSPNSTLEGVDKGGRWNDPNPYTGFNYPIPIPGLLEKVGAGFKRISVEECVDLKYLYGEKATLITAFYTTVNQWGDNLADIIEEIGEILPLGGQFLFTSDCYNIPQPDWASRISALTGTKGEHSKILVLPFPNWLRGSCWGNIQSAFLKKDNMFGLNFYLEDQIFETDGREIGLLRDSRVKLFTK